MHGAALLLARIPARYIVAMPACVYVCLVSYLTQCAHVVAAT